MSRDNAAALGLAILAPILALMIGCTGGTNCGAAYFENMVRIADGDYTVSLPNAATAVLDVQRAKTVNVAIERKLGGGVTLSYEVNGKLYVDEYKFE